MTALPLAAFQNGPSQKRMSDAEAVRLASVMVPVTSEDKAKFVRDLDDILIASLRPKWKDRVLRSVHEHLVSPSVQWEKSALGFVRLRGGSVSGTAFRGKLIRYQITPDWLAESDVATLTESEAKEALQKAIRTQTPAIWSVEPTLGGRIVDLNHEKFLQGFEWIPRYRGYELAAGVGSYFAVERVSGAVTEFWMNAAWLPNVRDEDVPAVDFSRLTALRQEALRIYAQADPFARAVAAPGGLQLQIPSFEYRWNEMTPRHQQRADSGGAVLVFLMGIRGVKASGEQTIQCVYVDATTGKGIAIHEIPFEFPSPFEGTPIESVVWRPVGTKTKPLRLRRVSVGAKPKLDRQIVLESDNRDLIQVEVDSKAKVVWIGADAWRTVGDWKTLAKAAPLKGGFGQQNSGER